MRVNEMISTAPMQVEKTVRGDEIRALTSCRAGKIVPLAFVPLLREDAARRGTVRLSLQMSETVHPLMNAVNVTAYAHFVPYMAFDRFREYGLDRFNRAYQKHPEPGTATVVPFFETINFNKDALFWKTLGVHWKNGTPINSAPVEAYNAIVNFRRKSRSDKLPERLKTDTTLAEAFWRNPNLWHIVPDFDQASMDGEVQLQFDTSRLDIKSGNYARVQSELGGAADGTAKYKMFTPATSAGGIAGTPPELVNGVYEWGDRIFAELRDTGVRLSLANIELAKKTAAFAKAREQYSGLDDDHIIDLLMEGIRVPDEALKQPMLLSRRSTIFGYSERHAMDGANLDKSVTTGTTELRLNFRTPPINTGGVIMITLEIVPEALFERMHDAYLGTIDPDRLPNFMRDYLDPEKVDVVQNQFVDVEHSTPTSTFGYAPLNHVWKRSLTRIGGKYYRRNPDVFVEDRQRFWSVEHLNPSLTADFYMVRDLPHSVFMDTLADAFEVQTSGHVEIVGNTVFGRTLFEDDGHYEHIMDQVDETRIKQS